MLKIKSDIDLKELEKYGLKLRYECNEDDGIVYVTEIYKLASEMHYSIRFQAVPEHYELVYIDVEAINILYNLIKDGLVVKVND